MQLKYPNLFSPLRLGNMMLKNRIISSPAGVPKANTPSSTHYDDSMNPPMYRLQQALRTVGAQTSMMYQTLEFHVPCRAYRSREELMEAAERSEKQMRETVDSIDFDEIKAALDGYYAYLEDLMEKNPRIRGQY